MNSKPSMPSTPHSEMIVGSVDTTYQTQQRDMFESGLAAQIGVSALAVWLAIKSHADFTTGEAYPGVRRLMTLTHQASETVQKALKKLHEWHLLRVSRRVGQRVYYVARERVSVRVGTKVLCTIVVDYVPTSMRQRLERLKAASAGDLTAQDVWAEVEVIPGPGFVWNPRTKSLKSQLRADEVPAQGVSHCDAEARCGTDGLARTKDWLARRRASTAALGKEGTGHGAD